MIDSGRCEALAIFVNVLNIAIFVMHIMQIYYYLYYYFVSVRFDAYEKGIEQGVLSSIKTSRNLIKRFRLIIIVDSFLLIQSNRSIFLWECQKAQERVPELYFEFS